MMPIRLLKKLTGEVVLLSDIATIAAALTGTAVILPSLAKLVPKDRGRIEEIFCRTGLRYSGEDNLNRFALKLAQAGIDKPPEWFLGMRLSLIGGFLVLCLPLLVVGMDLFWLVLLAPLFYIFPGVWLNGRIARRKGEIRLALADFSLLLSTALSAGSDILVAFQEAAGGVGGALEQEANRALMECSTAKSFSDAVSDMADRCDVDELRTLARVLIQARRYGTPLAKAMRSHSEQMRTVRRFEMMEQANKMSVKLVLPALVILCASMLAIGYPAVVSLLEAFMY